VDIVSGVHANRNDNQVVRANGNMGGKCVMAKSVLTEQLLSLRMAGPKDNPKPHKPLLVALLLKRFIHDGSTSVGLRDIEQEVNSLIGRFDASTSKPRAQYPFWWLRDDGFWEIDNADVLSINSSGDPKVTELRREDHRGRWTDAAVEELRVSGGGEFLELVLDRYFPSNGEAVRAALGV
jgi:hypothetical protein